MNKLAKVLKMVFSHEEYKKTELYFGEFPYKETKEWLRKRRKEREN